MNPIHHVWANSVNSATTPDCLLPDLYSCTAASTVTNILPNTSITVSSSIFLPPGKFVFLSPGKQVVTVPLPTISDLKLLEETFDSPPRGFNRFLNASDLVAEFIRYIQEEERGLAQQEFLEFPIKLFIQWLILKSAAHDQISPPEGIDRKLSLPRFIRPRCRVCGRFLLKRLAQKEIFFCSPAHFKIGKRREEEQMFAVIGG